MKNKNLFRESRFVWFAGVNGGAEVAQKTPVQEAVDFIKDNLFKDEKGISSEAYDKAVEAVDPEIKALIDAVLKDRNAVPVDVREKALARLKLIQGEIDKEKLKHDTKPLADRAELKGEVVAQTAAELDAAFDLAPSQGEIDTVTSGLNKWWMNVARDKKHVNAEKWQPQNAAGLGEMKDDWHKLGVPVLGGNPFYDKIFTQLSKSSDSRFLNKITDANIKSWYMNPADNLDKLQSYDNNFYRAWKFHVSIKDFMKTQDDMQGITGRKIDDLDRDSIAVQITDGVKSNAKKFTNAIRERDYATAAVYILGIWAMYKSVKKLSEGNEDYGKWLIYGAAAYCGNIFLKNAGYDVMKKLGLKDAEAEVMGTPLESMGRLGIPEAGDIDYAVYLRSSEVKISTLYNLYGQTHHGADLMADGFIDPAQFPSDYPEFKNNIPRDKQNNKEYSRVGHELYKIAFCLNRSYEKTLMIDKNGPYYGVSFKTALEDPVLVESSIRHFTGVLMDYAPLQYKKSLFQPEELKNADNRFNEVFKGTDMGASLEMLPLDPEKHVVGGMIMNYPVVVVTDPTSKKYRIFSRLDYDNNKGIINQNSSLGVIPFTGSATSEVADIRQRITAKMAQLAAPIASNGGRIIKDIAYNNGHWVGEVKVPGAAKYGIQERAGTIELIPRKDGRVDLKMSGIPVAVNMDYFYDNEHPYVGVLFANMVQNAELAALRPFYNKSKIKFVRELPNAGSKAQFEIELAGQKVAVSYDSTSKKFKISAADQKKLLDDPKFSTEYVASIEADENFELNETVGKLKGLIKKAPQNFFAHLWESLTDTANSSPVQGVNLDAISGSVPEYFSNTILDATKYATLQKLRVATLNSKTLGDVKAAYESTLHDTNAKLLSVYNILSKENLNKDSWGRDEFIAEVLFPIRSAANDSSAYDVARGRFEYKAYGVLNGVLSKSDFDKSSHFKAAHLINVFSYYTAYLDNPNYTYKDPTTSADVKVKINLDSLTWPPKPKFPTMDPKKDPGLRGHYINRYFDYVQNEIINRANGEKLDIIPDGSASAYWKIIDFDTWLDSVGSYAPLDPLDKLPPIKHDPLVAHGPTVAPAKYAYTELEKTIAKEFDRTVAILKAEYGMALNYKAIDAYLRAKYDPADPSAVVGKFKIDVDPVTKKFNCQLWQWADQIAVEKTRSVQVQRINELVYQSLVKHIFENPKDFFTTKISLKAKILTNWPGLRDIRFVPDWVNPLSD